MARGRGWIGIDIGADAVKLAQVERKGADVHLVDAAIVRRSDSWTSEDWAKETARSSREELQAGLSMAPQLRGRGSACMLPMSLYELRMLSLRSAEKAERRELVRQQLSELRGGLTDREFDFWSTDKRAESSGDNVATLSLPADWAGMVATDVSKSGLVGEVLDGPPLAMTNAVALVDARSEPLIALDWGFSRATLCVVENGRATFSRCLREGGCGAMTEPLVETLGVNSAEAQKVLVDYGLPGEEALGADAELQQVVADIAADSLTATIEELQRTLSFLDAQRRGFQPAAVWLFGGGATIRNIDRFVERQTNIPTKVWSIDGNTTHHNELGACPMAMLGNAIALSSLAWSNR